MLKIAYAISLMALLACGSESSNQGAAATGGDLPPVSAAGAGTEAVLTPEAVLEDLEIGAFEIESCLGLVASGEFADAIPICLDAAAIDPENNEVQAALDEAQAKVAEAGASAAAQAAAAETSAEAINDSIDAAIPGSDVKPPQP
jgi:hypothetical protein